MSDSALAIRDSCREPAVFEALTAYAFGDDLPPEMRRRVDGHLQTCGICSRELAQLVGGIRTLREDPQLVPLRPTPDVLSVLGTAGKLDAPFGGHTRFVLAAAALFAMLHAVPVVVEVAYE